MHVLVGMIFKLRLTAIVSQYRKQSCILSVFGIAFSQQQHKMPKKVVSSSEEDDKLVEAVAPHRILYDASHPLHKKLEMKNNVWKMVAIAVNRTGTVFFNYISLHQLDLIIQSKSHSYN